MARESGWQRWMPLIIAVIAFTGSALGTAIPRLFFTSEETQKRLLDARLSAYNDFFKGQVKNIEREAYDEGSPEKAKASQEYSNLVLEARFRIAVYGTKSDIMTITDYFGRNFNPPVCNGPAKKWNDDVQFYQSIRTGVFQNDSSEVVPNDRMILLLFNCRIPTD